MSVSSDLVNYFKLTVSLDTIDSETTIETTQTSDRAKGLRQVRVVKRWKKEKEIGRGSFGNVWLEYEEDHPNIRRAVKKISKGGGTSRSLVNVDYNRELFALGSLSKYKDVFVDFHGWYENDHSVYLAMEYFDFGDLGRHITKDLTEKDTQIIGKQLLEGLEILHKQNWAHRDLKPQNIFVVSPNPHWWVKIGDFGISKKLLEDETRTAIGTPVYTAPEILGHVDPDSDGDSDSDEPRRIGYTVAVDIWSLGCVLFQMLALKLPFNDQRHLAHYCRAKRPFPAEPLKARDVSDEGCRWIQMLMIAKPSGRLTAAAALETDWIVTAVEPQRPRSQDMTQESEPIVVVEPSQDHATSIRLGAKSTAVDIAEQLRLDRQRQAEDMNDLMDKSKSLAQQTSPWEPDSTDPFTFSATIMQTDTDSVGYTVIRGRLDSGCEDDWISSDALKRANLEGKVKPLQNSRTYMGFGDEVKPTGEVDIIWFATNAGKSHLTTFLVYKGEALFDMVLGRVFIAKEAMFVFNRPAIALRQGKFTREKLLEIQKDAVAKGAINEQTAAIRREDDAAEGVLPKQESSSNDVVGTNRAPNLEVSSYDQPPAVDARVREIMGGLQKGGALQQGTLEPVTSPHAGGSTTRAPPLNINAVKDEEARRSLTSLPGLIKRVHDLQDLPSHTRGKELRTGSRGFATASKDLAFEGQYAELGTINSGFAKNPPNTLKSRASQQVGNPRPQRRESARPEVRQQPPETSHLRAHHPSHESVSLPTPFTDTERANEPSTVSNWDHHQEEASRARSPVLPSPWSSRHIFQAPEQWPLMGPLPERPPTPPKDIEDDYSLERLLTISEKLRFRPGVDVAKFDLTGRELIYEGDLSRKGSIPMLWLGAHVVLFDHFLVIAKPFQEKSSDGTRSECYDVSEPPIPMGLLVLESALEEEELHSIEPGSVTGRELRSLYSFKVKHLGTSDAHTLFTGNLQTRQTWCDKIVEAKVQYAANLRARHVLEPFGLRVLADTGFSYDSPIDDWKLVPIPGTPVDRACRAIERPADLSALLLPGCKTRVNCATAFKHVGISIVVVGTDDGVFVTEYDNLKGWRKIITASNVTQISALEDFSIFLLISAGDLLAYNLDIVASRTSDSDTSSTYLKRAPQRLSGSRDVGFFAIGRMKDRTLLFYRYAKSFHSSFKVLEPIYHTGSSKTRFGIRRGQLDYFRDFDEFYLPMQTFRINLFRTSVAVATTNAFEILTLDKKYPLSIPCNLAECVDIAAKIKDQKPLEMLRLSEVEFLLVYEKSGIYVDNHGDITRSLVLDFVCKAKQAVLCEGIYLILADKNGEFIEVQDVVGGRLRQIIAGRDVRLLETGQMAGPVKICMQHPTIERNQIVLEMTVNDWERGLRRQ